MKVITLYRKTGKRKFCKCEVDQVDQMLKAGWSKKKPVENSIAEILAVEKVDEGEVEKLEAVGNTAISFSK